jgi:hypothetical protein
MPAEQLLNQLRSELATSTSESTHGDISIAEPKNNANWQSISQDYFGLSDTVVDSNESIAETEARFEQLLHRVSWEPISLTKIQNSSDTGDGESDEHYLYKAALVDSLVYDLFETTTPVEDEYAAFVNRLLDESEAVRTEHPITGENSPVPDIKLTNDEIDLTALSDTLFSEDTLENVDSIAIEFETGRQQAAFNYRKIRSTLEKYRGSDSIDCDLVIIIIPPSLLHMGKDRATQLDRLVAEWNELDSEITHGAKLFIPRFGAELRETGEYRPKIEFNPASQLIKELYPEDND